MARTRQIKPGFFKNEVLAELDPMCRLIFIGLWTIADREGRLEYRPKRIRTELAPHETLTDAGLVRFLFDLADKGFLSLYGFDQKILYVQVHNFTKHQHIHHAEPASEVPDVKEVMKNPKQAPYLYGSNAGLDPVETDYKLLAISYKPLAISSKTSSSVLKQNGEAHEKEVDRRGRFFKTYEYFKIKIRDADKDDPKLRSQCGKLEKIFRNAGEELLEEELHWIAIKEFSAVQTIDQLTRFITYLSEDASKLRTLAQESRRQSYAKAEKTAS